MIGVATNDDFKNATFQKVTSDTGCITESTFLQIGYATDAKIYKCLTQSPLDRTPRKLKELYRASIRKVSNLKSAYPYPS